MELPIVIVVLLTMASPFINAAIQRVTWTAQTKSLVALAVSAVIAILYLILTGGIADWSQLAVVAPMVYTLQQLIYQFLVKNIATKFEIITTPGSTAIAPVDSNTVAIVSDANLQVQTDGGTITPTVINKAPDVTG